MSHLPNHILFRRTFSSPVGTLVALSSNQALCSLEFDSPGRQDLLSARLARFYESPQIQDGETAILAATEQWLDSYFAGRFLPVAFNLDLRGTPFELRVWTLMQSIAPGTTATYGELAQRLGSADAARAVGGASRRNPIGIIVPCHRVIGSSGALTGYGGGLPNKGFLLKHESAAAPSLFGTGFGPRSKGPHVQAAALGPDR